MSCRYDKWTNQQTLEILLLRLLIWCYQAGVLRPRKKETLFYGRTDLPSRVGRSGHFFIFFFCLVAKMTPLKNWNFLKIWSFLEKKIWKKDFQLFSKIVSQIFFDFDFSKLKKKKNLTKWKNRVFFFRGLLRLIFLWYSLENSKCYFADLLLSPRYKTEVNHTKKWDL